MIADVRFQIPKVLEDRGVTKRRKVNEDDSCENKRG